MKTSKKFIKAIQDASKKKTSAYDTTAQVTRVEGDTVWVHIPGGVTETPVKRTIDAKTGDTVQVRVSGGKAFLVGNGTAPPTDDTTAKQAVSQVKTVNKVLNVVKGVAERAARIAGNTNQYFWFTETGTDTGAHITEIPQEDFLADPDNGGGNLLARSNGIALRDGLVELATLSQDGMDIRSYDDLGYAVEIAHLGYGEGNGLGGIAIRPYYSLGDRSAVGEIGNYSVAEGYNNIASEFAAHCEGCTNEASGLYAHAEGWHTLAYVDCTHAEGAFTEARGRRSHSQNYYTIAEYDDQTVMGRYNDNQSDTAFEIGNGTSENARSNAFTVDWDGEATANGYGLTPHVLHDNDAQSTTGAVTLSETAANFKRFTICFRTNDGEYGSTDVYHPNGKTVLLTAARVTDSATAYMYVKSRAITISGTSVDTALGSYYLTGEGQIGGTVTRGDYIAVTQVIGWK